MDTYRNEAYWRIYDTNLYNTILILSNNQTILNYLKNFNKRIDYISNVGNIEICSEYSKIKMISIDEIKNAKNICNSNRQYRCKAAKQY